VLPVANIIRAFCNNKRIRRTTTAEKGGSSSHNDNETEITVSRDEDLLLYGGGRVAFITHKAHAKILQKVFRDCKEQVILDLVDFPILYHSSNSSEDKFSSCAVKNDPKIGDNRIKYEQRDHHHSCSRSNALAEMKILYEKTKGYMAQDTSSSSSFQTTLDVIVYNLYTLAGYHICEALSVPGLVLACGIIPPSSRKNDQRRLKDIFRNQPYLKWAMETKHHLREKQLIRLNASDLEHWMLPLWSSHYQAFRLELGLGAFPLSSLRHHHHHVLGRCTEIISKGHKTIATAAAAYIRKEEDLHHGVIKQVRRRTRVIKHQQEQKKKNNMKIEYLVHFPFFLLFLLLLQQLRSCTAYQRPCLLCQDIYLQVEYVAADTGLFLRMKKKERAVLTARKNATTTKAAMMIVTIRKISAIKRIKTLNRINFKTN